MIKNVKLLFGAAQLAQLALPLDINDNKQRCVVTTPEASILHLINCLEQNPTVALNKRIERLNFLMKFFESSVTETTYDKYIDMTVSLYSKVHEPKVNASATLLQLREEINLQVVPIEDELTFDKIPPTANYVPTLKQAFHDKCQSAINHDGYVYDVFAVIAVVTFKELLSSELPKTPLRNILLERSKLIFKGGEAIGKFLFKGNDKLWESMSANDKAFVVSNFINKGDIETSLSFEMLELHGYTVEQINNEIELILYDIQHIAMENVKRYQVEKIIMAYIEEATLRTFEYAGRVFSFRSRRASSFAITEKEELLNEFLCTSKTVERIFASISRLQFSDSDGNMVKFFLSRVKAAYHATMESDEDDVDRLDVNCYVECLDISAACIDSATQFEPPFLLPADRHNRFHSPAMKSSKRKRPPDKDVTSQLTCLRLRSRKLPQVAPVGEIVQESDSEPK